jgi:hypothetical protein
LTLRPARRKTIYAARGLTSASSREPRASAAVSITDDLDPLDAPIPPNEAEPPLVVDPNAVLARSAAAQSLQPVSGRRRQIAEVFRRMQLQQRPLGYSR